MPIGERLRIARKNAKMSARRAGEITGLNYIYIYEIERNKKKNPSLETIIKLAEAYNDPSLVQEFMRQNNITDVQIDISLSHEKERLLQELSNQDQENKISHTLFEILKHNDEALDEWTKTVNEFIRKYKK